MSSPVHPRRRPQKPGMAQMTPLTSQPLRKSGTFHSPTGVVSDLCDPLANAAYMPKRSTTTLDHLEQELEDAGVRRVASLLERFDNAISGRTSSAGILRDPEVLPLPNFMLRNSNDMDVDADAMDIDTKPTDHHHTSDSGLGSSVGDPKYDEQPGVSMSTRRSVTSSHAAITKSISALGGATPHYLGKFAVQQIKERIVDPILAEESLKDFHPLVADVPRRIGEKYISNLRDLEKTLLFLAPEFSATPDSYLRFCERSIALLHATVDCLSELDQRRPTDRPYTNNYFLDLVEQIRRYAAIMAATRQKQEAGEDLDDEDYSPHEKITLRGGLSHDGKPAELIREKDGKAIPLNPESEDDVHHAFGKRTSPEDDTEDEGARRSMARRRKSDKPGDVMHSCRTCDKEFKRPCDLTKHEKTHSRPFKCREAKCKFATLGWPTEKERDRHENDRHSADATQFKCQFLPCAYASKRESNCKQHMEKAHGWVYKRSKSNGRKKATPSTNADSNNGTASPTTPLTPFMGTPAVGLLQTPISAFAPSPDVPLYHAMDFSSTGMATPAMSEFRQHESYRRTSDATVGSSGMTYSSGYSPLDHPNAFVEAVTPEETTINHDVVFDDQSLQFPNPAFHTPLSINTSVPPVYPYATGVLDNTSYSTLNSAMASAVAPHLSPCGHAEMTLYDETFAEEDFGGFSRPQQDFTLYGGPTTLDNPHQNAAWFPGLGDQFGNLSEMGAFSIDEMDMLPQ